MVKTLVTAALLLAATGAQAQLWQCPKPGGGATYQEKPCVTPQAPDPQIASPTITPAPTPSSAVDKNCAAVGEMAFKAAQMRDRGFALTKTLAPFDKITIPEIRDAFRTIVIEVYTKRWLTPEIAQQQTEVACIKGLSHAETSR